ncbi:MAG TPA: tetratricopeptide repeat protein [Puia sp.]|nr:tetratricopeptide repeat protein [Puia sp.]
MDRIEKLKEMLVAEPDEPFLKHALALEYVKIGELATARRLLEEVLTQHPDAVGSYYQLGKLLESMGETALAIDWYSRGMTAARAAGERRAYNELQTAYEELAGD